MVDLIKWLRSVTAHVLVLQWGDQPVETPPPPTYTRVSNKSFFLGVKIRVPTYTRIDLYTSIYGTLAANYNS